MPRLSVFVSSTIEELREERARIKMVLEPLGLDVFLFELDAGARSESTRRVYSDEVLQCDIYIGLFKHIFSAPTKEEYELALANSKEILIYIFDTSEKNREKELSSLLMKLGQAHTRKKYRGVEELEGEVRQNVLDLLKRRFKQSAKQVISTEDWLKLLEYKADLYTPSANFGQGDKDCWKLGHFGIPEIASSYDARRPITNEIINSLSNNIGTILLGRPFCGKTLLLRRVMYEALEKGYTVLYVNDVGTSKNLLVGLLVNLRNNNNIPKLLVVADDVHKRGSEEFFKCLNNISASRIENIRFLFAARSEELEESLRYPTEDAAEINYAMKRNLHKTEIHFSESDAEAFVQKVMDLSMGEGNKGKAMDIAHRFYQAAHGDPLIFTFMLTYNITDKGILEDSSNFLVRDLHEKKKILDNNSNLIAPAMSCTLLGVFGISSSPSILYPCRTYVHELKSLHREGFLVKNQDFKVRHELWALEFLTYLYTDDCESDLSSFDAKYEIADTFRCLIKNLDVSRQIGLLNICSLWLTDERYISLGQIVMQNFVIPENLDQVEKSDVYCFGLATFYSTIGRSEDAIKYYDKALEINPAHVQAWNNKGNVYDQMSRFDEALTCYNKAIEFEPKPGKAYLFYNKASTLNNLQRYDEANTFFDNALRLEPTDSMTWLNKGIAYHSLNDLNEALKCYDKAIQYDSGNVRAWIDKGNLLLQKKDYLKAIECYDSAKEINSKEILAWQNKGRTYDELGEYDKAIECYDSAKEINAEDSGLWLERGLTFIRKKRYDDALQCFEFAIKFDTRAAKAWTNKGALLSQLGRYDEAMYCHHIAIGIHPQYAIAWYNNALNLLSLRKFEEAITWLNRSLDFDPNHALAWSQKGKICFGLERYQEALLCFDKVIIIDPTDSVAWIMKGIILLMEGNYLESRIALDRAVSIPLAGFTFLY